MCNEWQPISTAPQDGTDLLLFHGTPGFMSCEVGFGDGGFFWASDGTAQITMPTHWMPIPVAPVAALQDGEAL